MCSGWTGYHGIAGRMGVEGAPGKNGEWSTFVVYLLARHFVLVYERERERERESEREGGGGKVWGAE